MDVKSVALQLRKLSSDPDNQVYIVNEKGCMKGLLGFLDSNDPEVLGISLQALQFLSSHPLNKEPLSKMDGLLPKIVGFTEHESESVRRVAAAVLDNMQDIVNGGASSKPVTVSTTAHHPVKPAALPTSTAKPNAAAFTPSYLYSVPLQIKERLSQTQLTQVERALLQIKGVVSITVNSSEVMVYCRCQDSEFVQVLLAAIKNLGLTAIAGQGQDESKVPPSSPAPAPFSTIKPSILTTLATASLQSRDKENSGGRANAVPSAHSALGPAYLTPAKPAHGVADPRKALVEYTPYGTNRTESRAEQRKASLEQQQQKNSTVRSLFGAVTSYFW